MTAYINMDNISFKGLWMLWEIFFECTSIHTNCQPIKKEDIHTILNVHIYAMIAHKLLRFYLAQVLSNLI